MLRAFSRAFKTPDLRKKLLFTLFVIVLFRLGSYIPAPGVDYKAVQTALAQQGQETGVFDLVNIFSGGALLQISIFALGIMPYITASIITQLLRVVIPRFKELWDDGQTGRTKLNQYTRYITVGLALLNATTLVMLIRSGGLFNNATIQVIPNDSIWQILLIIIVLTAGTGLVMWMAEMITERGVGNGMSLLIFTSIVASFPGAMNGILESQGWGIFALVIVLIVVLLVVVTFVELSQRRVPVQYAGGGGSGRTASFGTQSTYIPLKINMAGVVPVIFASAILYLPLLIAQFNTPAPGSGQQPPEWVQWINNEFKPSSWLYMLVFFVLIIFFTYFYVSITFNPEETADNLKQSNGYIPGIRAGRPTADYLRYVIDRITFAGAIYLALIAMVPLIFTAVFGISDKLPFGGTSLLIVVGVGLEIIKQIDAQLQQRSYDGLLKR